MSRILTKQMAVVILCAIKMYDFEKPKKLECIVIAQQNVTLC